MKFSRIKSASFHSVSSQPRKVPEAACHGFDHSAMNQMLDGNLKFFEEGYTILKISWTRANSPSSVMPGPLQAVEFATWLIILNGTLSNFSWTGNPTVPICDYMTRHRFWNSDDSFCHYELQVHKYVNMCTEQPLHLTRYKSTPSTKQKL